MMNFLVWSTVFVLATSIFSFSRSYGHIKRVFQGLSTTLIQEGVILPELVGAPEGAGPCFDEKYLPKLIDNYLRSNLAGYFGDNQWHGSVEFSAYEMGHALPQVAKVTLAASFMAVYRYEDSKTFTIQKGNLYGQ